VLDAGRLIRLEDGSLWLVDSIDAITSSNWLPVSTIIVCGNRCHKALELTLPPAAIDILRSVPRRAGSDHVFGRRGTGFVGWSYPLTTLNLRIAEAEGRPLGAWSDLSSRRFVRLPSIIRA
jgi:hypothetical protein